jgi:quinol monooxygenase YgiN
MYVVCVTFETKPGQMETFLPLMRQQAENSLKLENGCLVFDVCLPDPLENRLFLYEKYANKAAFQVHLESDHFQTFDAAVADMVHNKVVETYETA